MPASLDPLVDPADRELAARAWAISGHAHAPYSRFRVGAAVRTVAGQITTGCNVENASYGLSICAERSAVFAAVALEGGSVRLAAIAVGSASGDAAPCGACRQVLAELGDPDLRVIFREAGAWKVATMAQLLPYAFSFRPPPAEAPEA